MIRLSKTREPFWLEAPALGDGVRFHLKPVTPAMVVAGRAAALNAVLNAGQEQPEHSTLMQGVGAAAFVRSIIQAGLIEVEGIGDQHGEPLGELSPAKIDAMLAEWPIFDFLDASYVTPALRMETEKNASSLSENGTSGAKIPEPPIASTAPADAETAPTA